MTDLSRILPDFPIGQYARLLPAIERQQLTTTDLLMLEVADIGKRTQLPLLDVKRLCAAVLGALHVDLGVSDRQQQQPQHQQQHGQTKPAAGAGTRGDATPLRHNLPSLAARWRAISTLDASLDAALGGGVPVGHVTEITGESGAGKTQLLLTLLLAAQLPPARGGLGRPALYISTEAPLSTVRLSQILRNHPRLQRPQPREEGNGEGEGEEAKEEEQESNIGPPSLDNIISTVTPDLESQDHILSFQVPVEVARRNVGLVVLDSVAANYRAEFERGGARGGASGLAARGNDLVRLGRLLHELARQHDLAVVVSNQVADRFPSAVPAMSSYSSAPPWATPAIPRSSLPGPSTQRPSYPYPRGMKQSQESPLASRSRPLPNLGGAPRKDVEPPASSVPAPTPPPRGGDGREGKEKEVEGAEKEEKGNDQKAVAGAEAGEQPKKDEDEDGDEDEEEALQMMAATAVRSSMPAPVPEGYEPPAPAALLLDHQQRWFTGWGDDYHERHDGPLALKTPSLGLVWSTQVSARIALFKRPVYYRAPARESDEEEGQGETGLIRAAKGGWRRWLKVVFAPHVAPSAPGLPDGSQAGPVEFEITMGGLRAVERKARGEKKT